MGRISLLLLLTGASALVSTQAIGAPAQSQDIAQPATAPAGDGGSPGTLSEVIVTAQKRYENLQATPVDVQAFSSKQISATATQSLFDLEQLSPGLIVTQGIAVPEFNIRGVGQFSNTISTEQDVSIYVDGVYRPAAIASIFALNTVSNIEVDKGPQGTLYGRNAIGGLIQVTTRDPSHHPELELSGGYGNYDTYTASAYAGTSITDDLAANVALYYNDQVDGWGINYYNFKPIHTGHELSGSTKWVYQKNRTKVTLEADYDNNVSPMTEAALASGLYNYYPWNYGQPHVGGFWDSYLPIRPYNRVVQEGASLKIEQDLDWAQLVSVTSGRYTDSFLIQWAPIVPPYKTFGASIPPSPYVDADHDQTERTITEEVDLLSPSSSRIKWSAGLFYLNDLAAGSPQSGGLIWDQTPTSSIAAFAQATTPILYDSNHLTVGYRFTSDARSISGRVYSVVGGPITFTQANNPEPSHTWTNSSYKVSFDHRFTPDIMAYVSNSTGYQSGFYNLSAGPEGPPSAPETIMSTEVGLKADLFDKTLRFDASAYYYTIDNLVVTIVVENPVNLTLHTVVENAAATRGEGLDFQTEYRPPFLRNLSLGASINLLDARYTDFKDAAFLKESGNGLTWTYYDGDASGNEVAGVEKVQASVDAEYTVPLGESGDILLAADASYHGPTSDSQNLARIPSWTLVNATAKWTSRSGRYSLLLWCKNLTNTEYSTSIGVGSSQSTMNPAPPRTFGFTVGYRY